MLVSIRVNVAMGSFTEVELHLSQVKKGPMTATHSLYS